MGLPWTSTVCQLWETSAERAGEVQSGVPDVLVILVELRQNNLTVSQTSMACTSELWKDGIAPGGSLQASLVETPASALEGSRHGQA